MAERDGRRIAAVLAADAEFEPRVRLAAELAGHLHKLADTIDVEMLERVVLVDLRVVIRAEELRGVVAAEAEGHLRQVVRAEAEEVRFLGDLIGRERGARDLDHGADVVLHVHARLLDERVRRADNDVLDELELLALADQRDHDVRRDHRAGLGADLERRLDDGVGLHLGDLRIGDAQAAAAVAHHGVELMQGHDNILQLVKRHAHLLRQLLDVRLLGGQELVQRGIEIADGHRAGAHDAVHGLKVALLERLDLRQCDLALLDGAGADHLADGLDAVLGEEHMLGAAQADALGAEVDRLLRVARVVGIGLNVQAAGSIGPAHETVEILVAGGGDGRDLTGVDVAGAAVEGDPVALREAVAIDLKDFIRIADADAVVIAAAGDAAGAHAAGDDGRVAGHAAAHGQDALRDLHAHDVLGAGLEADEHDLRHGLVLDGFLGLLGGEHNLPAGGAGGCGKTLADGFCPLERLGVKLRVQERIELLGLDAQHGLALGNHALVDEVARDLQRRLCGALAVAGLEHVELAVLDGELHVLHILKVVLKAVGDRHELVIHLRHLLLQMADRARGTHACDDVLALCIDEVLAHELLRARGRVAREGHARAGAVAGVAERHLLDVDGGAPLIGDLVHLAVDVRARVIPAAEHGLDRLDELLVRVLREGLVLIVLIDLLEDDDELLEITGVQIDVVRDALGGLHLVDLFLKQALGHAHDDVRKHLHEAAVAVVSEAGVAGLFGQALDGRVVQAQVEDGVHHTGHGLARAGAHGHQQGIFHVAELLAGQLLKAPDMRENVRLDLRIDLAAVRVVLRAGLGRDGEALRHRHAGRGHLREAGALAAENVSHRGLVAAERLAAFAEIIQILFAHSITSICSGSLRFLLVYIIAKPARPRQNECAQSRPNLHNIRKWFLCSLQDYAHIRRIFRNQIQNL